MTTFGLLLDSGVTWPLRNVRTRVAARVALEQHNAKHRAGMVERVRCNEEGDYMSFPLVLPRMAVGLVSSKRQKKALAV